MESMNDKVRDMRSQGHWGKPHGWKMLITDGCERGLEMESGDELDRAGVGCVS